MKKIKAIIFDMDGVISDTIGHHTSAESVVLSKYGIHYSPDEIIKKFNALPDHEFYKILFSEIGKEPDLEKLDKEKFIVFKKLADEKLIATPGAITLIYVLSKNNFLLGVASSAPSKIVDLVLTKLQIKKKFKSITTPEDVKKGKPFPDSFLYTAKKLGVSPQECLVIEDAPRGIEAAKKSGMKCIAIATTHNAKDLQGADKIINSFEELTLQMIESL